MQISYNLKTIMIVHCVASKKRKSGLLYSYCTFTETSAGTKMPAGVSWPRYTKMLVASVLSMFAGAEVVHRYYRPDLSIPEIPPRPGELQTELLGLKTQQTASEKH